ncbi:signal recognition particle subunit srp68 [Malassezia psittaci]|uniref:Signal recognition particle subunit SRP68 n=1 Tax=Malassezia psittaci TaxID=1821823 RepID=A0AAF0F869_9BASI|nr:signal recognition particle subunit srp68 [Malassezia psittaci]
MEVEVEGQSAPSDVAAISFPVLQLISEARNEHGMRQQDWKRYRIRANLHLTHGQDLPPSKGTRSNTRQRKRRVHITPEMQSKANKGKHQEFVPKTIKLGHVKDARPLELLLFETEHAWASAEEIWSQQGQPTSAHSVLRKRSLTRGRRAVQIAKQLKNLVDSLGEIIDVSARAQYDAYFGMLSSAICFIKGDWDQTQKICAVTRELLTVIADCAPASRDEALASSFLDILDARARFAAYSLGEDEQDTAVIAKRVATPTVCEEVIPGYAKLIPSLKAAHGAHGRTSHALELHWRAYTIPVHGFELHDAVTRVSQEEQQLQTYLGSSHEERPKRSSSAHAQRQRLTHAERNAKRRGRKAGDVSRQESAQKAIHGELDSFDRMLGALTDAEEAARSLVEENERALQKSHSARYEAAGADLRRAHEYLLYRLLSVRIERNMRLVEEVQAKAAKREEKAASVQRLRQKIKSSNALPGNTDQASIADSTNDSQSAGKPTRRKPGRSGVRANAMRKRAMKAERASKISTAKSERRAVRIVPGIAKLLENIDNSIMAIGSLELIEGEPDVSSLIEAKQFFYSAMLLTHLARAFSLHGLCAEALLLHQRAELYVRQTSQALELAEGAEDQDTQFAPKLLQGNDALSELKARLNSTRKDIEGSLIRPKNYGSIDSLKDTRSGQTLYHYAQRHVSFDPDDLALALKQATDTKLPTNSDMEVDESTAQAPAPMESAGPNEPTQELRNEASFGAYDPTNALLEQEEEAMANQRSRGSWLGGWFRKS